ncbi:MAG: CoA transferase [Caulobacteraceae bacterium]
MLEGVKIVEFSTYVAGPCAAMVLGEWGADVIKVESRTGDATRAILAGTTDTASPVFEFENRNKRGLVLDVSKPEGREALVRVLKDTDIFITNLRPGGLKRAGIDYEALKHELPHLVYCSVTGYGLEGEAADLPAFDIAALWTRSGLGGATIPQGVEPFPCRPGTGDAICALATASACLAAYIEAQKTGKGRLVETSLMRAGVYTVGWDMSLQLKYGQINPPMPRKQAASPISNYFRTSDERWVCIWVRGPNDWGGICRAAGLPHLLEDERFSTPVGRTEHKLEIIEQLDDAFEKLTLAEMCARLTDEDVIFAPLQTPAEVMQDDYARAAGCFVEVEDAFGAKYEAPAAPARFPGADDGPKRPAPKLGEHTREILAEAGYSPGQIDAMLAAGSAVSV